MAKPYVPAPPGHTLGWYRPHDPDLGAISFEGEVSLTHQSFRDECDINHIMKRYEKTGILDHVNKHQGAYGDFTQVASYQDALQVVSEAERMFLTLPARIRAEFDNDPGTFLQFATNPDNGERMVELGLAERVNKNPPAEPTPLEAAIAAKGGTDAKASPAPTPPPPKA